jgi:hypothetical protein
MPVMGSRKARRLAPGVAALALASALAVATASAASAAPAEHGNLDFSFDLPDPTLGLGPACAGFDVRLSGTADKRATKQLPNGVLIEAGNGWDLTFTNLSNDKSVTLLSNGSVNKVSPINADGIQTFQSTGKNVLILFPTDDPEGPSSTLYTGRLVYTVDTETGVFTVQSSSGQTTDLCAAVA